MLYENEIVGKEQLKGKLTQEIYPMYPRISLIFPTSNFCNQDNFLILTKYPTTHKMENTIIMKLYESVTVFNYHSSLEVRA